MRQKYAQVAYVIGIMMDFSNLALYFEATGSFIWKWR